jgi:cytochrome b
MKNRILVWDIPTRVFHWSLALSFAGAWLTAESERYRDVHVMLGYTLLGLIAFRLVWGLVGTRYARFYQFVRSPSAVLAYLKSLFTRQPEHHVGHNPAGAIAILLLLALGIATGVSGWMSFNELGGEWLEEGHEILAGLMLAMVGVHIVGVVAGSLIHRENLARAMVTGYKHGDPAEGIRKKRPIPALVLLTLLAGFWGFWSNGKIDLGAPGISVALEGEADKRQDVDDCC